MSVSEGPSVSIDNLSIHEGNIRPIFQAEGDNLSYQWIIRPVGGFPAYVTDDRNGIIPAPRPGEYVVEVTVTDAQGREASDSMQIEVVDEETPLDPVNGGNGGNAFNKKAIAAGAVVVGGLVLASRKSGN